MGSGPAPRRGGVGGVRLLIGLAMAGLALFSYLSSKSTNPITGEEQHIAIQPSQEIALGLQAAPEMMAQYGGPSSDAQAQSAVGTVGEKIRSTSAASKSPYEFHFTLLADPKTVNAFALPGGPVFITEALFHGLHTEGQLAGVLGHEMGHVIARHSAEQIAKQELSQGLTGALILSTYDPNDPSSGNTARVGMLVASLVSLRYGRQDELEADRLGVRLMSEAGYDPRALIEVMKVLAASGGSGPPEFFSTHPNPENRIEKIEQAIAVEFPGGVPAGLVP